MKWRRLLPVFAVLLGSCASLELADDSTNEQIVCGAPRGSLVIDGSASDAAWTDAVEIDSFGAAWSGERVDGNRTRARLLCGEDAIYFVAAMRDDERVVGSRRHDGRLWTGDVFELFFKPDASKPGYFEFQINPAHARLDMYIPRRRRDAYDRWRSSRAFQWQTAVDASDGGWTVEGRIPWSDFAPLGDDPRPGDVWRFALCRYDYSSGEEPELSCNAPLTRPDFHRYEEWVELRMGSLRSR